ncbi:hypothetical protein [Ethanoligenens harbinense]|uniref:Uncharacterized protein n=1 Tax=Ethanoligenens harbinense (strain DSM 18485 / JCM 12961 / CGMCC 1.5033 / YUAN-3) TaxID=663278 RepID=E6U8B2_ETHHY|nr:hypothetical protein [Ethanoligenens harbinense]ADU28231.1 hypothetical protein Ethha_2739 [Ethanoligenens harbinense YUAN-3]
MLWLFVILMSLSALWAAMRRPRTAAVPGGLFCMALEEDDSDIKIAGQERRNQPEEEALRAAEELEHRRRNGDLERARALGGELARQVMAEDIAAYCAGSVAGRVHLHCRLVLSCAVYDELAARLPGKVLADVARSAFNETLEGEYPNFYKQMTTSGAQSFYTLSLRGADDPADELGRTFARLTDREGNDAAARDGARLYRTFAAAVDRAVDACGLRL